MLLENFKLLNQKTILFDFLGKVVVGNFSYAFYKGRDGLKRDGSVEKSINLGAL